MTRTQANANARKTRKHEKHETKILGFVPQRLSWFSCFRDFRVFTGAGLLLAVVSASAQTPSAQPTGNAQNGKELYVKYSCYACHGYDGHGGAGARLVPMRMNLLAFTTYIKNPRQMPPYTAKVLSDAQAADLWAYIKTIPESPAADKIPLLARIISEK